ncbi:MAG: hypothetical protein J1E83_12600 [Lachnospiraceae bacterium]|nr:hypothetical protein [Lachnospiraceae bacterium]
MDLRPINPYYKKATEGSSPKSQRVALKSAAYTYPYVWILPVTDRAQADIERAIFLCAHSWQELTAEQQEEYLAGLKGCINHSDLMRIENDIQILLDVLEISSASHVESVPEFPKENYFEDLRANVTLIRQGYHVHTDTPQVPVLPYNIWQKYNDLERILADVYEVINAQFHYYAGEEIFAGDDTGLLL